MKRFILIPATLCIIFMQAMAQEKAPGYYKIDIKQITPKEGITTGHVIAYGHYIKPPYKIEVRDTIVFINDVQIFPIVLCVGKKKEKEKELEQTNKWKNSEEYKTMQKYHMEADDIYNNTLKATNDTLKAVKKAVKIHLESGLYDSITFDKNVSKNRTKFWYKGWSFPVYYEFTPRVERKVTYKGNITRTDVAQQIAESLRKSLGRNRIKYFGYTGEETKKGSDIYKIANILNNTALNPEQKIAELENMGILRWDDVVYNYQPSEWVGLGCEVK